MQLLSRRRGHGLFGETSDNQWLLPVGVPGQPLTSGALLLRLRPLGIVTRPTRNMALMDLAAEWPAAVLSQLLGLSHTAGGDWVEEVGAYRAAYAADVSRRNT